MEEEGSPGNKKELVEQEQVPLEVLFGEEGVSLLQKNTQKEQIRKSTRRCIELL